MAAGPEHAREGTPRGWGFVKGRVLQYSKQCSSCVYPPSHELPNPSRPLFHQTVKQIDSDNTMTSRSSADSRGIHQEGGTLFSKRPITQTRDTPKETRPRRCIDRKKTSTFPQSVKETGKKMTQSINSNAGPKERNNELFEFPKQVHGRQPSSAGFLGMPGGGQQTGGSHQDTPYEMRPFDNQLNALLAAYQKEPGRQEAIQNSKRFVEIWEAQLLPKIEQILDGVEKEYTINVSRDAEPGRRTIVIVTGALLTKDVEKQLRESKSEMLPSDLDACTSIVFRQGDVKYLHHPGTPPNRSSSTDSNSSCTSARNIDWYADPAMGDSVGWKNQSATLGPLLQIDRRFYRLLSWHLFDDDKWGPNVLWDSARPPKSLVTVHPSPPDLKHLNKTNAEKAIRECQHLEIGEVAEYSGRMYKTTRPSVTIGQDREGIDAGASGNVHVVTDWALVYATEANDPSRLPRLNIVRQGVPRGVSWETREQPNGSITSTTEIEITRDESPADFIHRCEKEVHPRLVYSVGRTSGYTIGELSEVCGTYKVRDKIRTREWVVERARLPRGYGTYNNEDAQDNNGGECENENANAIAQWIYAGMGISGDSGAGVFSLEGNTLLGQVWGRNAYSSGSGSNTYGTSTSTSTPNTDVNEDPNPRIVYFTAMADIYADIRERVPGVTTVQLPTQASINRAWNMHGHAADTNTITNNNIAIANTVENRVTLEPICEAEGAFVDGFAGAEELNDADLLGDDGDDDEEQERERELDVVRRSAAKAKTKTKAKVNSSRPGGPVGAARILAKQAGLHHQQPQAAATHRWNKVMIHAATF